jgi:hypothetical protein
MRDPSKAIRRGFMSKSIVAALILVIVSPSDKIDGEKTIDMGQKDAVKLLAETN